jgi:hypothetical protein
MIIETKWGNAYLTNKGYYRMSSGEHRGKFLHTLIWEEVNGPVPERYHIHHIDGNSINNTIHNLMCLSPPEHNNLHKTGTKASQETKDKMSEGRKGQNNSKAKITECDAYQIKILCKTTKLTHKQIADCIPRATLYVVDDISSGRSWKEVEVPV